MTTRVLLADDERDFASYTAKRLEARGLEVRTARDGHRALELISRESFDVVVLDLLMPGIDGLEVLERLRASQPELPVVLLSGHAGEELAKLGMELGAVRFLNKPCELDSLLEAISEAVHRE